MASRARGRLSSFEARSRQLRVVPKGIDSSSQRKAAASEERIMDDRAIARIENDPNYIKLVRERKSFGWTLTIIMLVLYYGYIALVAFDPSMIAQKFSGSITIGILMGIALILAAIVLTGVYVLRANSQYDDLTRAIVDANAVGGRK
jgi:uncharacterized membrane protein (DUF485 family)